MSEVLTQMECATAPAVAVRFSGKEITPILKKLSYAEIRSCGDFSLISLESDKKGSKKQTLESMSDYAELQHSILKLAMVSPTYKDVEEMLLNMAGVPEDLPERMRQYKLSFIEESDPAKKKKMSEEYAILEMRYKLMFPPDFCEDVFNYAVGRGEAMDLLTEEMLYEAALIAGDKGRPSDIICADGEWFPHNKADIDKRAKIILNERRKKQ